MKYTLMIILIIGCSSKAPEKGPIIYSQNAPEVNTTNPKNPSITAKQLAAERGSSFVTEIRFAKGSANLNRIDKSKILNLYKDAQNSGATKSVEIISWADKEYSKEHSLSMADQKLAETRTKAIKDYLENLDSDLRVKEINMSKKPAKLTGLVNTYEADVKKSLEIQNAHKDKKSMSMIILLDK